MRIAIPMLLVTLAALLPGCGKGAGVVAPAGGQALVVRGPRQVHEYGAGDSFSAPATGIHRMDHAPGAVTIHVYSPPLREIGHYEVVDAELRRRAGRPDEASPPSPGLSAALAHEP